MSATPLVSIIIPAYNGERYINAAIDSALMQDGVPFEIIVIDDGSTDGTVDKVLTYGDKVRFIKKQNGGVASARNAGIRIAQGRYIALLDQDDKFLPDKLKKQVELMERNPNIVLSHANITMIDEFGNNINNGHLGHNPTAPPISGFVTKKIFQWNFILACTVLIRRDALLQVKGFNENLWGVDDYELWLRLSLSGDVVYLNEIVSEYRWHDSNASQDEFKMAMGRLLARIAFLDAAPQAKKILGEPFIKDIIAGYVASCSYPLYKNGRSREARQLLNIGLRHTPTRLKLWKMYLATFLP